MLAVLGVVVAAVAAVALVQQKDTSGSAANQPSRTVTRTAPASTPPASSKPKSATDTKSASVGGNGSGNTSGGNSKDVPLVVLNNSTVGGLAKRVAKKFEDGGWTVTSTDNLKNDILSSAAYYDPNQRGARKAADALRDQFPGLQRVVEKFPELPPGPVVVVLTGDYPDD